MWQVRYLPRPPTLHYPHQNCHVGWGPGWSQPCQVSSKSVQGFWLPDGSKSAIFLCLALWLIQQVRATAQPVKDHAAITLVCAKSPINLKQKISEAQSTSTSPSSATHAAELISTLWSQASIELVPSVMDNIQHLFHNVLLTSQFLQSLQIDDRCTRVWTFDYTAMRLPLCYRASPSVSKLTHTAKFNMHYYNYKKAAVCWPFKHLVKHLCSRLRLWYMPTIPHVSCWDRTGTLEQFWPDATPDFTN